MGTSGCYKGPGKGSPLIPSWLDPAAPQIPPTATPTQQNPNANPGTPTPVPMPQTVAFQGPRVNMTRFVKSGGTDKPLLRRAISQYAKATGGTGIKRMVAARNVGTKVLGFLSDVRARGADQALRVFRLEHLSGQPIEQIFVGLADFVCPISGGVEEGLTREAFFEAIAEFSEVGLTDLNNLASDQVKTILGIFVAKSIEARLIADIAVKSIFLPQDVSSAEQVQKDIGEFIRGCVVDAIATNSVDNVPSTRLAAVIDDIYRSSFELMKQLGETEGGQ